MQKTSFSYSFPPSLASWSILSSVWRQVKCLPSFVSGKFLDLPVFISAFGRSQFLFSLSLCLLLSCFSVKVIVCRFNVVFLFGNIFPVMCSENFTVFIVSLHYNMQIYTRTRTTNSLHTKTKASWLKKMECQMNLTSMEGVGRPPKTIDIFNVHKHFKSRWNCLNQGNVFEISLNVTDTFASFHLYSFPLNNLNIWMNPYQRHRFRYLHFWHFLLRFTYCGGALLCVLPNRDIIEFVVLPLNWCCDKC